MVGVPGRSKGCQTCRDRRIKCDLAKPSCLRCVKSKRKCSGYRREATFVYFDADDDKPSATYKPPAKNTANPVVDDADRFEDFDFQAIRTAGPVQPSQLVLHSVPRESNNIFRDQFLSLFLTAYLPKENDLLSSPLNYGLSWTQYLPGQLHMSDALSAALTAVSTAMVGRSFGDERLVQVSHQLYGTALSNLRRALKSPKTAGTPDTLGATMALSNYELMQPSGPDNIAGWVAHVQGAAQILQSRTYASDQSPMEKALLIHVKQNCIFDAMSRRRSTFMADDKWRLKLMGNDVPDALRNIIVDLPSILEKTDYLCTRYRSTSLLDLSECFALLVKCESLDTRLEQWHSRAWQEHDGPLYWIDPTVKAQLPENGRNRLFEDDLNFPSLPVSQMMTSYWSTRALIHDTMEQILREVQDYQIQLYDSSDASTENPVPTTAFSIDTPGFNAPISIDSCNAKAMEFAEMVCRCVTFCTKADHRHMGIQAMTQPLWLTQQIFRNRDSVKSSWCLQASKVIATRGLGMMERIALDFGFQDYAASAKPGMAG